MLNPKTPIRLLVRLVLRVLFRLLFRVQVRGNWQALKQPRVLVVANHESFLDGMLLGLFMPGNPVFVVHTWVAEHWLFRPLLALTDYLAVDPTSPMGCLIRGHGRQVFIDMVNTF